MFILLWIMDLINWSLSAIDTILGSGEPVCPDGTSRPDIRGINRVSGGSFCGGREDIYLFGTMITGILLIGLGFDLGYRKIWKTGTAVQSLTRLPVWIEAVGRAVSNETETINPEYGCHHVETYGFAKIDYFRDQNGQREQKL